MIDDSGTEGQVGRHGIAVVNGPEGDDLGWLSIDWQQVEGDVLRPPTESPDRLKSGMA